jgi:Flp pilus assembly pilin Flp
VTARGGEAAGGEVEDQTMCTYVELLRQRMVNEQGAEIVEWVLWVGAIAVLAGTLYTVVSGAVSNLATNIITGMTAISGS